MEGLEMEDEILTVYPLLHESQDICAHFLSLYKGSPHEDHQHLCTVIGAISQELQDHSLPLTPTSYSAATISSLDRISDQSSLSDPIIMTLLTLLSSILPSISTAVLRVRGDSVLDAVWRFLGFGPEVVPARTAKAGLKCVSHLMVSGEKGRWESVGSAYRLLLEFVTGWP